MRLDRFDSFFFFFQAEDGIRDYKVTGVQTCALPILEVGGGLVRCWSQRSPPPSSTVLHQPPERSLPLSSSPPPRPPATPGCSTRCYPCSSDKLTTPSR